VADFSIRPIKGKRRHKYKRLML